MYRTLALAITAALATPPALSAAPRPNILLILADDLGYSDLGCYGGEIATPNLDKLAADGLRFTRFYNCTRCCPSRASLLTGLYPHQAGVGLMTGDRKQPGYRGFIQPNAVTIAEVLRGSGYHTLMCGKWHLASGGRRRPTPIDRGFEDFYGLIQGFDSFWDPKAYVRLPADRPARSYPAGKFHATDAIADHALDFLADARKSPEKPFFLYLAFNAPHFPLHAAGGAIDRYAEQYARGWDRVREDRLTKLRKLGLIGPEHRLPPLSDYETLNAKDRGTNPPWDSLPADRRADLARRMAIYAAMVEQMDRRIGDVIESLRKSNELDNTLVLFLSDNGACAEWDPFGFDGSSGPNNVLHRGADLAKMGGPGTYHSYGSGWANACNTPFRLYKHYCHEGGISTPLIAHWPKGFAAKGERREQVGHVIDIMATCLDVAGAKYPDGKTPLEGMSLTPAFSGEPLTRDHLAWEHEGNRAIRVNNWKLVATHGGPWELYDLDADRAELNNLAAQHPDRVKELARKWNEWARRTKVFPKP